MLGYTELLQKNASSLLDEKGRRYMMMILESAKRMGTLIDDLLSFSRIGRAETRETMVSLEQLVKEVQNEVWQETEGRNVIWKIGPLPDLYGDRSMLKLALVNLISNAVKFSRTRPQPEIEIGCTDDRNEGVVVFVKDNGVGFDMKYVDKLFGVFQRLHASERIRRDGDRTSNGPAHYSSPRRSGVGRGTGGRRCNLLSFVTEAVGARDYDKHRTHFAGGGRSKRRRPLHDRIGGL